MRTVCGAAKIGGPWRSSCISAHFHLTRLLSPLTFTQDDFSSRQSSKASMAADPNASSSSSRPEHTTDTFRPLLKQLILSQPLPIPNVSSLSSSSSARPLAPALSSSELDSLFDHLSDPAFTSDPAHHAQLGACLTGLRLGGVDAQAETLAIASQRFLGKCIEVDSNDGESWKLRREEVQRRLSEEGGWEECGLLSEAYRGTVDLVGTGGDGQDTFNVSTTAAIVASGVPGVRICKVSHKSGANDLYQASELKM